MAEAAAEGNEPKSKRAQWGPTASSFRKGEEWLESHAAEKDLGVLVDSQLNMTSSVARWPRRPIASWLVSEIAWPAELGKRLSLFTRHW